MLRRQGPGSAQLCENPILTLPLGASRVESAVRHHVVLNFALRPRLDGVPEVLAKAFVTATPELRAGILVKYSCRLCWATAQRLLISLADALALKPLTGALTPIKPITSDLDLEPGTDEPTVWRNSRWRVRWPRTVDELLAVIGQ